MTLTLPIEEISSWIRLSLEPGLGPAQARHLLKEIGLPSTIYATSTRGLTKFLPAQLAQQLRQSPDDKVQETIARTLAWLDGEEHHLVTLGDPSYPDSLLTIHDPPLLLYVHGRLHHLAQPAISIVGSRSATAGGLDNARAFARHLAQEGWCIISGLASGIDTAAHEGALQAGPDRGSTVAILGTGIDIVYPARNRALAHQIAEHGALVSEFPLGTRAIPYQFPKRNRLVAGMSRGVLVVEAAKQSGSLITARLASEMGREVFAIPGSIHSPLSRGCHALIRQGAKLVESAEDIRDELGTPTRLPQPPSDAQRSTAGQPGAREAGPQETMALAAPSPDDAVGFQILQALGYDPVALDTLHDRTRLDVATLGGRLMEMELQGLVGRQDDGRFMRR